MIRRTSIPDPCRSLAKPKVPTLTQIIVAMPNDNAFHPFMLPSSAVIDPWCAPHRWIAKRIGMELVRQHRDCRPTEFEVDHRTAWHHATKTAASKPGPKIGQPASNNAFKIMATAAYCTNIV